MRKIFLLLLVHGLACAAFAQADQASLGESKWLAARPEDSSRRNYAEETFRKLCERLRYSHLV